MKEIEFKGKRYIFGGDNFDDENFIATKHQYKNGLCSFAHYYPEQGVMRFRNKIGNLKDIKVIKDNVEILPNFRKCFSGLLGSETWPFNL